MVNNIPGGSQGSPDEEMPKKIQGTDKIDPSKPIEGSDQEKNPSKSFESYMNEPSSEGTQSQASSESSQKMSPAELTSEKPPNMGQPTMESVQSQMKTTSNSLGDMQQKLKDPNLQLKSSEKHLLKNKLSEANSHIRAAAAHAGAQVGDRPEGTKSQNPITRFLSLVADGQNQLDNAQKSAAALGKKGGTLSQAKLLQVQMKVAKAQQEIEYSSVILSNAVGSIKQLFNVQL